MGWGGIEWAGKGDTSVPEMTESSELCGIQEEKSSSRVLLRTASAFSPQKGPLPLSPYLNTEECGR